MPTSGPALIRSDAKAHTHEYTLGNATTSCNAMTITTETLHCHELEGGALTTRPYFVNVADHYHAVEVAGTFDGQVGASGDDGWSVEGSSFNSSGGEIIVGASSTPDPINCFALWDPVAIPAGATITLANLVWVVQSSARDGANTFANVFLEAADDPSAPTTEGDHTGRTRTSAFTTYDSHQDEDEDTITIEITAVLQEVIDRDGWNSGQAILCLFDDDGSAANKQYRPYSYDGDTSKAASLHVEYVV